VRGDVRGSLRTPDRQPDLDDDRLRCSGEEALDELALDTVLIGQLGRVLAESYLAVRRSEWTAYSAGDAAFEQQGHFEKY
jgi:glutamine synthetase